MNIDSLDLYPAALTIGMTRWPKARVVLRDSRLYVARVVGSQPVMSLAADVTEATRDRGRMYRFVLDDGRVADVRRGSGCGCNSPLKNLTTGQVIGLDQ